MMRDSTLSQNLVIREAGAKGNDLSLLAMQGDHTLTPLLQSPFNKTDAEVSPDGHWMALKRAHHGKALGAHIFKTVGDDSLSVRHAVVLNERSAAQVSKGLDDGAMRGDN